MQNFKLLEQFDPKVQANILAWLNGNYDEKTKEKIWHLLEHDPQEIENGFYTHLNFGTGGMRGLMGVGTNRINCYTLRIAAQGLANYLKKEFPGRKLSVIIGFDSRKGSQEFAENAALVLIENGIQVFMFKDIRPTPLVSFGCRFKNCDAGIMITASHNPSQYNGFKIYGKDGGQVRPPQDLKIVEEMVQVKDVADISSSLNSITFIDKEIDDAYIKSIASLSLYPKENQSFGHQLKIVYTSLHGTGITLFPKLLENCGYTSLTYVEDQIVVDGDFPTAPSPNPEEKAALSLGIKQLLETGSDLLIAQDPDADRLGVVVLHQNKEVILNGNQIACICLEHIFKALSKQNALPLNGACTKTFVTTELFKKIADGYGIACFDLPTGCKYLAEKILQWENDSDGFQFIFGAEESYGYLWGTYTRDKDALSAGALICEAALQAKLKGKTLVDVLHEIYKKYGVYFEKQLTVKYEESKKGKEIIKMVMQHLRENPLKSLNEKAVVKIEDNAHDMLAYWLEDKSKLIIRPSGTEPKVKVYCGVVVYNPSIEEGLKEAEKWASDLLESIHSHLRCL